MTLDLDAALIDLNRKDRVRPYLALETSDGTRITEIYYDQVNIFEWEGSRYFVETPFSSPDSEYHLHRIDASMTLAVMRPAKWGAPRVRAPIPESDELIDRIYFASRSHPVVVPVPLREGKNLEESMVHVLKTVANKARTRKFKVCSTFRGKILKVWRKQ